MSNFSIALIWSWSSAFWDLNGYVQSIDEVGRRNVIPAAVGAPHCGIGPASTVNQYLVFKAGKVSIFFRREHCILWIWGTSNHLVFHQLLRDDRSAALCGQLYTIWREVSKQVPSQHLKDILVSFAHHPCRWDAMFDESLSCRGI